MAKRTTTDETETIMLSLPVPRAALTVRAAPPETLSQRNVEAATGIPVRMYLYLLREPTCDVPIVSVGKLRIVQRAPFIEWLMKRAKRRTLEAIPDRADVIAAQVGLRPR